MGVLWRQDNQQLDDFAIDTASDLAWMAWTILDRFVEPWETGCTHEEGPDQDPSW